MGEVYPCVNYRTYSWYFRGRGRVCQAKSPQCCTYVHIYSIIYIYRGCLLGYIHVCGVAKGDLVVFHFKQEAAAHTYLHTYLHTYTVSTVHLLCNITLTYYIILHNYYITIWTHYIILAKYYITITFVYLIIM